MGVTSDRVVKSKDCTAYGKNVEEKIFVYGKKLMGVCAVAGMYKICNGESREERYKFGAFMVFTEQCAERIL